MIPPRLIRGLYAIADTHVTPASSLLEAAGAAMDGGARVLQYRDKGDQRARRVREAGALAQLCRARDAIFLVNDDVELAAMVHAHGVHIGRADRSLAEVRARLGNDAIVGVSCYADLGRARAAEAAGASYVAFGSFFPSTTKPKATRVDMALLRTARSMLSVPIVAIGGITPDNGAALVAAGADALAVIAGLFAQPDIRATAERYAALFSNS